MLVEWVDAEPIEPFRFTLYLTANNSQIIFFGGGGGGVRAFICCKGESFLSTYWLGVLLPALPKVNEQIWLLLCRFVA